MISAMAGIEAAQTIDSTFLAADSAINIKMFYN